ncbi:MAG: hypothetical protein OXS35_00765 [Dehalococcoidia bacterium]|nr:hypothetical protein [Dehalococcoidia bacterium]
MRQTYGDLVRVDADAHREPEILRRVPLGSNVTSGGVDEATLQDLAFSFPQTLPNSDIDPAYAGAVPICKELSLPAGYADALYCNQLGRLTLSEFKLWRNPQARREVIGQILDYAKDLAGWGYDDLQRQVSLATGKSGNVPYDSVRKHHPEVEEAEFVDNVARHLRRGEFLLLIVGDGIREDAADIVDFVQRYSGLHFNLAMVEAALYRDSSDTLIVQPRVLARTEIVRRFVVDGDLVGNIAETSLHDQEETLSDQDQQNLQFWSAVVKDFSFADTSVEVPVATTDSTLYVTVKGSGFGGWALCFDGYLHRRAGVIGCLLTARKGYPREVRIFESMVDSLDKLREETAGELEHWENASGRPRIGFRRQSGLAFLEEHEESEDFRDAVLWMRDHLNRLVSTLNPRLQALLADDS